MPDAASPLVRAALLLAVLSAILLLAHTALGLRAEAETQAIADRLRARSLPCDTILITDAGAICAAAPALRLARGVR